MKPLLFNLDSDPFLANQLRHHLDADSGLLNTRQFPDQETYLRIDSNCQNRDCVIFCNLYQPNSKILPLIFLADTLRELGAARVVLITPYLCYMRQDIRFQPGECVNAYPFGKLLSQHVDFLVTMDPHLHRIHALDEVYQIPTAVVPAAPLIAFWVVCSIVEPLFIGPDSESEQWVSEVARLAEAPYVIMEKVRHGDRDVDIHLPDMTQWQGYTPVLVDDIISSGKTMQNTLKALQNVGLSRGYCIGVHGLFADNAYAELKQLADVVTTRTVPHASNQIEIAESLAKAVTEWLRTP